MELHLKLRCNHTAIADTCEHTALIPATLDLPGSMSWSRWPVTYRDGLPIYGRSPN